MIHEGAHGIQAPDLLGRKVVHGGRKGLTSLATRMNDTIMKAHHAPNGPYEPVLADHAGPRALQRRRCHQSRVVHRQPDSLLTPHSYLQAFGHTVLA